jgi:hypothetical protein
VRAISRQEADDVFQEVAGHHGGETGGSPTTLPVSTRTAGSLEDGIQVIQKLTAPLRIRPPPWPDLDLEFLVRVEGVEQQGAAQGFAFHPLPSRRSFR